ncbi:hypothetical protein [Massilia sp. IC2-476]|uniref:hypothetical protein n=1 Tax=Massilia sp. IC2-476 TaxID=2887199 RepID=UPI001D0FB408|nr:hypothetical protein [Massilia sp. IC2-476]MCC2971175.1 hypothetical protein [Massilia sp. IC2-476]
MKKTLIASALFALGLSMAHAEPLSANGSIEVSVKANNGDLIKARRVAREQAENDAVLRLLKLRLGADPSSAKVRDGLVDLRKQLADNMKTSFNAEGDVLTAKTALEVDAAQFMDMARVLGITSTASSASAKVLFLIDEYYGVGTKLDPSQPLVTEIDYSHDKSSMSDYTATSSGAKSASSSSASAQKSSFAAASSEKSAFAASSQSAVAARDKSAFAGSDKASFSGSDRSSAALQDGYGGAAAGARSTQVAGARDTRVAGSSDSSFAASQKSAAAGSSSSQAAVSASSSSASAAKSASASSFATRQNAVEKQNDVVNLKVRQVFPGIDNAKPSDDSAAMINQKLQQVVREYNLSFTDEKDFRIENGRRLTNSEIARQQKFDMYLQKAAQGNYKAKYLVYGTAVMNSEGTTSSGHVSCAGQLMLTSSDVDTGEGFISGTIVKRALGSSDQNCRANLSEAMARALADNVGTNAQRELQVAASRGRTYVVALYSDSRVPAKLRRDFSAKIKDAAGVVEVQADDNASEGLRRWTVVAKGNFSETVEDLIDEIAEGEGSVYKNARFEQRGNRMVFCVEGKCPVEI